MKRADAGNRLPAELLARTSTAWRDVDGGEHNHGDVLRIDESLDAVFGFHVHAAVGKGLVVDGGEPVPGRRRERVLDADGEAAGERIGGRLLPAGPGAGSCCGTGGSDIQAEPFTLGHQRPRPDRVQVRGRRCLCGLTVRRLTHRRAPWHPYTPGRG